MNIRSFFVVTAAAVGTLASATPGFTPGYLLMNANGLLKLAQISPTGTVSYIKYSAIPATAVVLGVADFDPTDPAPDVLYVAGGSLMLDRYKSLSPTTVKRVGQVDMGSYTAGSALGSSKPIGSGLATIYMKTNSGATDTLHTASFDWNAGAPQLSAPSAAPGYTSAQWPRIVAVGDVDGDSVADSIVQDDLKKYLGMYSSRVGTFVEFSCPNPNHPGKTGRTGFNPNSSVVGALDFELRGFEGPLVSPTRVGFHPVPRVWRMGVNPGSSGSFNPYGFQLENFGLNAVPPYTTWRIVSALK